MRRFNKAAIVLAIGATMTQLSGCGGDDGDNITYVQAAEGTVSGVVQDAKGLPVPAAVVSAEDTGGALLQTATTDANGAYSLTLPVGQVVLKVSNASYSSPDAQNVGVLSDHTVSANFTMDAASQFLVQFTEQVDPIQPVNDSWTSPGWAVYDNQGYGTSATVGALVTGKIDDMPIEYTWENRLNLWDSWHTEKAGTVEGDDDTALVTFSEMMKNFESRVDPIRGTEMAEYKIPDRLGPLTISQDRRGLIAVRVQANDAHGQQASIHGEIHATNRLLGIRNVALGERIYLNRGNDDDSQVWSMVSQPTGSTAELVDANSRTPYFFPDKTGEYDFVVNGQTLKIFAGKYMGVITGIDEEGNPESDATCTTCHQGGVAGDQFTPWSTTMHANIFRQDVAISPAEESMFCGQCHAVGGDIQSAPMNNGLAYVAEQEGYKFSRIEALENPRTDAWPDMVKNFPKTARMMNIQCESCHGPQNSPAHGMYDMVDGKTPNPFTSPRISFSAELCSNCHYERIQWTASKTVSPTSGESHMNEQRALELGTDADCGRCHSAQGFVAYEKQLQQGNVGKIDDPLWSSVTADNVEPVTCTACHDPHGNGNDLQVRIDGDTPDLPAGFNMPGVGQGATCIACHNTAQGVLSDNSGVWLHEDNDEPAPEQQNYNIAHGSQGDVFAGRNAWFMGNQLPMVAKHAVIDDSCVKCHQLYNPTIKDTPAFGKLTRTHQFWIDADKLDQQCNYCHGSSIDPNTPVDGVEHNSVPGEAVDAGAITASVAAGLDNLAEKMQNAAFSRLTSFDSLVINYGEATVAGNQISAVALANVGNKIGLKLTLSSPAVIGGESVTELTVSLDKLADAATGEAVYLPNSNFVKGAWNYFLINNDRSQGIHNLSFSQAVINNTVAQVF
ncbi:hypothetical protein HR45_11315 [Shewanella mangrovi]|uniref:Uncharacterized protein n=1 Tax=Shewanella mangrovi TaxID=1515746 RepID=A0A094JGV0_9GAMM|nr:carboxypeptidase regulatory-like domain-containing protein [Shewanella mangrovi]KFZ37259.1 hypothetical protein HR45_11315 [Shewanella mangrovi]